MGAFVRGGPRFGEGQQFLDVTNERAAGVNYINSTARPILVFIRTGSLGGSCAWSFYVGGELVVFCAGSSFNPTLCAIVNPGESYSFLMTNGVFNLPPNYGWREYR